MILRMKITRMGLLVRKLAVITDLRKKAKI